MNKPMSIAKCLEHINELAVDAQKMRRIIDDGPDPLRYKAAVVEEHLLEVIARYVDHINQLKELSVNGTFSYFDTKPSRRGS